MTRQTLLRQLQAGIITQDRYDRILDIIEHDDKTAQIANTKYIDNLILAGLRENRRQSTSL